MTPDISEGMTSEFGRNHNQIPPLHPITFENGIQVTLCEDGRLNVTVIGRGLRRILIEPSANTTCYIAPSK